MLLNHNTDLQAMLASCNHKTITRSISIAKDRNALNDLHNAISRIQQHALQRGKKASVGALESEHLQLIQQAIRARHGLLDKKESLDKFSKFDRISLVVSGLKDYD